MGVSVDELIKHKMQRLNLSYDEAYEEVIADSCESFLVDSNLVEQVEKLAHKDKNIAEKIKSFISDLLAKVKKIYANLKPDSAEGKYVLEMRDSLSKLHSMWSQGIINASQNHKNAKVDATKNTANNDGVRYSERYRYSVVNKNIIALSEKVDSGVFKDNEKVFLGVVDDSVASEIENLTGINVKGYKIVIEARQIEHIKKDHGKNGKSDSSMADNEDIAKIEFALKNYDSLIKSGKTSAYTYMKNGRNKTADTILYEKSIGEESYYVVQAVPEAKSKTLYIVTAFIGKSGYKKGTSQLINAKSPDATSKDGSVVVPTSSIPDTTEKSNTNIKKSERKYQVRPDFEDILFDDFDGEVTDSDARLITEYLMQGKTNIVNHLINNTRNISIADGKRIILNQKNK